MSTNVLVIDDHALIRMATEHLINQQNDMTCVGAVEDPDAAQQILNCEPVDVAVCDLQFTFGNALGFIAEQTKQKTSCAFLVCSAHRPEVYASLCAQAGARGYVHKSNDCNELVDAIREVVSDTGGEFIGWKDPFALDGARSRLATLTTREWQVLNEIGRGVATKEIGKKLFLSAKTIESHRASIKRKLQIRSKDYLVSFATELCCVGLG